MSTAPIYSVSDLNIQVKRQLELSFPMVGVTGELSNLVQASSGHYYFSLKDSKAQIRCAYFIGHGRKPSIPIIKNGLEVLAYGKLSLYEPRGDYQLIVSFLQDTGLGLLYQQFVQLKNELEKKGLFDTNHKKPLPKYPKEIAIITSPKGAAIHDIQTTLRRRYPLAQIKLYPTEVQGESAPIQILNALKKVIQDNTSDCIILARGGGSIEDLWAFNDETLAYAIYNCSIPIITGIGHESDFTIADFVADERAATPTAAAEKATPNQIELLTQIQHLRKQLIQWLANQIQIKTHRLERCQRLLTSPEKMLVFPYQRHDYALKRLKECLQSILSEKKQKQILLSKQLEMQNPKRKFTINQDKLMQLHNRLLLQTQQQLKHKQFIFEKIHQTLVAIGPDATLNRGYAIAIHEGRVLMNAQDAKINDHVEIKLSRGSILSRVEKISNKG